MVCTFISRVQTTVTKLYKAPFIPNYVFTLTRFLSAAGSKTGGAGGWGEGNRVGVESCLGLAVSDIHLWIYAPLETGPIFLVAR